MRLEHVDIEGFRSIRQRLRLPIDARVTVLLGANDHGKTNVLTALTHINADNPFAEDDLNWDVAPGQTDMPRLRATFTLSDADRSALLEDELASRAAAAATGDEVRGNPTEAGIPQRFSVERAGIGTPRRVSTSFPTIDPAVLDAFLVRNLPRVELIEPVLKLPDGATPKDLAAPGYEFIQGIFLYAGLPRAEWDGLFVQTDRSSLRLEQASKTLNETLRESWSQGSPLEFLLDHDSQAARIDLKIKDPAVATSYTRASKRSTGFTNFFAVKTILFARQDEHPANSYIWLFDEAGLGLHPAGQHDLLQVLEALADGNQIAYSTHSLFLINKNFPTRHRLVAKTNKGTIIDAKPYVGQWRSALDALGLALPATILFASHVLLTEGDSDPILLSAILPRLVALNRLDADLNPLGLMSTGESRNTDALIRILSEARPKPRVAALFDGDQGGRDRRRALRRVLDAYKVADETLLDGTTVEDHLILARELYPEAATRYAAQLVELSPGETEAKVQAVVAAAASEFKSHATKGLAAWALAKAAEAVGLDKSPSKVGVGREYATLLLARPISSEHGDLTRPIALSNLIVKTLQLPAQANPVAEILEDDPALLIQATDTASEA